MPGALSRMRRLSLSPAAKARSRRLAARRLQGTATTAERAGIDLPWTPFAHDAPAPVRGASFQHPMSVALEVARPMTAYPFYDAATATHWGQTPRQALQESGDLWARYAATAARNPNAWIKRPITAQDIITATPDNRLIAWPYTKLMVANPTVSRGQPC